jgi:alpha-tubulin suppressor-like RCC1 family protein
MKTKHMFILSILATVAFLLTLNLGCTEKDDNEDDSDDTLPSGKLIAGSITDHSIQLFWGDPTGDVVNDLNPEFKVFFYNYSFEASADTIVNRAIAYGNYETNIRTRNVRGLLENTEYYFTVMAKGATGNRYVYTVISAATVVGTDESAPSSSAEVGDISLTDTDKLGGYAGGIINIGKASNESSFNHYVIYWWVSGTAYYYRAIAYLHTNGRNLTYELEPSTDFKGDAGGIWVKPQNHGVEQETGKTKEIWDNDTQGVRFPASSVAAGAFHSCAILKDGNVACWGNGAYGALGNESIDDIGDGINEMSLNLGTVNLGTGKTATQIAAGFDSTCALLNDGSVKCWGKNSDGELGQGNTTNLGDSTGDMGDTLIPIALGNGRTAKQIAAGSGHACALLDNDEVKCWGKNASGQLGQGNEDYLGINAGEMGDNLTAIDLNGAATRITAGDGFTCALMSGGSVKCWGEGSFGALGKGNLNDLGDGPNEMGSNLGVIDLNGVATQISAGDSHVCALLSDNTVKCWGGNFYGQLGRENGGSGTEIGDDSGEMGSNLNVIDIGTGRTAKNIYAGGSISCAILDNDTLKCWGENTYGALGQGVAGHLGDSAGEMGNNLNTISLGAVNTATQASVGLDHVCALLTNEAVKCWGYNSDGQLGLGHKYNKGDGNDMGNNLKNVPVSW